MKLPGQVVGLGVGLAVGAAAAVWAGGLGQPRLVRAAASDRYQDFAMCTGAVSLAGRTQLDGVWLLDYKSGKLLGTVIDKSQGKIVGWAEVDLVTEYDVQPRQDVHFMMVSGYIANGQSALYLAETATGKFGVYTMGPGVNGQGVVIRRHDQTTFRKAAEPAPPAGGDPAKPVAPVQPAVAPAQPGVPVPGVTKVGG